MKPGTARTVHTVDFGAQSVPRRTLAPTGRVPRVARLLALAYKIDEMIRSGELRDLANVAQRLGRTRARVTQIANLLLLAPEIQEAILALPSVTKGRDPITERQLRRIVAEPDWDFQMKTWKQLGAEP